MKARVTEARVTEAPSLEEWKLMSEKERAAKASEIVTRQSPINGEKRDDSWSFNRDAYARETSATPEKAKQPLDEPDLIIDHYRGYAYDRTKKAAVTYGKGYFAKYQKYAAGSLDEAINAARLAMLRRHDVGARNAGLGIIDVGIGCGRFVEYCREHGEKLRGYDVNRTALAWLKHRKLLADPYREPFAALCLWDVLEHLPEPDTLLSRVPVGGLIFCALPIINDFRWLPRWKHYRPGEHLHYWTHDGLVRWFASRGFECLESNDAETTAGREDIRSYVFRRVDHVVGHTPGLSVLITAGIGDWLAVESWLSDVDRSNLETIYYAARQAKAVRTLIDALPRECFPRLKHHVELWTDWGPCLPDDNYAAVERPWGFANAADLAKRVRLPPGITDWSIFRVFAQAREGKMLWSGSSYLRGVLRGDRRAADLRQFQPKGRYALVVPATEDARPPHRNYAPQDWLNTIDWLTAEGLQGLVVGCKRGCDKIPRAPNLTDLRGKTTLAESVELLKGAVGYRGIDSWLSVLAAELFDYPDLQIKSVRKNGAVAWRDVYYPARTPTADMLATEGPEGLPWLRPGIGV
jgi:hypothetical protein